MKKQRKYKTNKNLQDKYYTKLEIASKCIKSFQTLFPKITNFLEPSAGTGSFSCQINNCTAIDISPKNEGILKINFFKTEKNFFDNIGPDICCIGNPPFGRNASLAIKFFNHAAKFCKYIAFILPKTFRKISIQNKLNVNFHLVFDEELPKNGFIFENNEVNVPCIFQIWKKKDFIREIKEIKKVSKLFCFVTADQADLAVRRVGGNTGKIFLKINNLSEQSNYFIKLLIVSKKQFIEIINNIDFSEVINSTAGVRSLSKNELISLFEKRYYDGN